MCQPEIKEIRKDIVNGKEIHCEFMIIYGIKGSKRGKRKHELAYKPFFDINP